MPLRLPGIFLEFARGLFRHGLGENTQRTPGLKRANIGLGGALEVIKPVKRLGHGVTDHHHPVIAHDQHLLARVAQQPRAAGTLVLEGQSAIGLVDDMAVVESGTVLVDGRQAAVLETGEHGGMDRMHVHGAARLGAMPVQAAMQAPGGRVRRVGAVHRVGVGRVHLDQVAGADAREMALVGVHQEARAVLVDGEAEMVGHRLVHAQPRGPAERGGEIHAVLPVLHVRVQVGHAHMSFLSSSVRAREATHA